MRPARSVTWPLWNSATVLVPWHPLQSVVVVNRVWFIDVPVTGAFPNAAVSWHETHSAHEAGFAITIASRASLSWQVRQLFMLPGKPFEKFTVFPFDHCHVYVWS